MADVLKAGADWLRAQRKAAMGVTVTYRRGDASVEVTATVGQTLARIDQGYGATVRLALRDYLIDAEDLVLAGAQVQPQAGDRVEETDDAGAVWVYEVVKPGGNEQEWRWHDRGRQTYRIHTKFLCYSAK